MSVLVLGALRPATGNEATCRRIATELAEQHEVLLIDHDEISSVHALRAMLAERGVRAALGLHALLGGWLLAGCGVPYAVILGGTDVFEYATNPHHYKNMTSCLHRARRVVSFHAAMATEAARLWPDLQASIACIPQAVMTEPSPQFSLRRLVGLAPDDIMLLLPCSLRPVKDPLFVADAVAAWHLADPRVHLVIVGPEADSTYTAAITEAVRARKGVHLHGPLARPDLHRAIAEADLVLNTSRSEGMPSTVLESMQLGTPVLARHNIGNASLIRHGETGILFTHPAELVHHAKALLSSDVRRQQIIALARAYIVEHHGLFREQQAYLQLVDELAAR